MTRSPYPDQITSPDHFFTGVASFRLIDTTAFTGLSDTIGLPGEKCLSGLAGTCELSHPGRASGRSLRNAKPLPGARVLASWPEGSRPREPGEKRLARGKGVPPWA